MAALVAARLGAHEANAGVVQEGVEEADRVRAAADARDQRVGQPALALQDLLAGLAADHRLQVAYQHRIRVRAGRRADQVVGRLDVRDPVADGLVHGVLEGRRAGRDGDHLGAQHVHPNDVGVLAADVLLAHVDEAFEPEAGAHGGRRHAVLAGAGLGDDPPLAQTGREQRLADARY